MPNHKLLSVERATDRQRWFGHLSLGALLDRCVAEAHDPAFRGRDPTRTAAELVAGYLIAFYDQRDADVVQRLVEILRYGVSEVDEFSEV